MSGAEDGPRLDGAGTPETVWAAGHLQGLAEIDLGSWREAVVVAPHPDDEVLACGGLLQRLARGGTHLTVVSLTDGEASHPGSPTVTPEALAGRRVRELDEALRCLGLDRPVVRRLGLPDGGVAGRAEELARRLAPELGPGVLCVAPWAHDGHPDHDAAGGAAAAACAATSAGLVRYLVWTWHWAVPGDERVPWPAARRLALTAAERSRKGAAVAAFGSQIGPLSDHPGDEAVLSPGMLAHFARDHEVFLT